MENLAQELYDDFKKSPFKKGEVALLCIDLQYHDAKPGYGFFEKSTADDPEFAYYFDRLETTVFPNVKKLQDLFRTLGQEVIHAKIESLTRDGRDRSPGHKRIGCHVPKGSKAAEIIEEVAPMNDEIVFSKTASGVFNCTNIDYVLRNLGIKQLVTVGVLTNECIETTIRDGADKGYEMFVVRDGVAALSKEIDDCSMKVLDGVYAKVMDFVAIKDNF